MWYTYNGLCFIHLWKKCSIIYAGCHCLLKKHLWRCAEGHMKRLLLPVQRRSQASLLKGRCVYVSIQRSHIHCLSRSVFSTYVPKTKGDTDSQSSWWQKENKTVVWASERAREHTHTHTDAHLSIEWVIGVSVCHCVKQIHATSASKWHRRLQLRPLLVSKSIFAPGLQSHSAWPHESTGVKTLEKHSGLIVIWSDLNRTTSKGSQWPFGPFECKCKCKCTSNPHATPTWDKVRWWEKS